MCGIVGYIGKKEVFPILLGGLKRLEYRGYDSAGVAVLDKGKIELRRCKGKIADLEKLLRSRPVVGTVGIGHTRWATHGRPSEENAHPHTDCRGRIVVVHNGIIENYSSLKEKLKKKGHKFKSETDTEVIAHLIENYFTLLEKNSQTGPGRAGNLEEAVRKALLEIEGSYAIGVISSDFPQKIIAARKNSPLIIGLGKQEYFIASDAPAILSHTRRVLYLEDDELAVLSRRGVKIKTLDNREITRKPVRIQWDSLMAEKTGYPHFMLKEIYEQPFAVEETVRGRIVEDKGKIHLEKLGLKEKELRKIERIIIISCGTSWHAGLVGEYVIEEFSRLPVEVEYAAEFRYRNPILDDKTLVIAISQSGETADTLAALKEARLRGTKVISICNVVGSSIARASDGVIYTRAGPEIGVASTKAFTTQLSVLYLLAVFLGRIRKTISPGDARRLIGDLRLVPHKLRDLLHSLDKSKRLQKIAGRYYKKNNFLYLGRGKGFAIALEGALKLKEVSYIHAEGYPAAEMKHGPIALIDENMPVVVLALQGRRYKKILANIEEVKSRKGIVIALATEGDKEIKKLVDETIYIPPTSEALSPILAVVPLQLLAYHIAVRRGCNVDQPRNLAKSVTVE